MGIWEKIFSREKTGAGPASRAASRQGVPVSVQLPPELDGEGDLSVREVIKSHDPQQLQDILAALPVEAITLDQVLSGDTRRHDRLFELCIQFSSVLANYAELRRDFPEFGLPEGYPARKLANIFIPRFVNRLKQQNGRDILPAAGPRLLSLAMDLIKAGRYQEACECLAVCQDIPAIDRGEVAFWGWACLHNIATKTRNPEDLRRALSAAKAVPANRRSEVAPAIKWAKEQLKG